MIPVQCTSNTSKTLPFKEGHAYLAECIGGAYKIYYTTGVVNEFPKATVQFIIAPLDGHYVKFEAMKK